MPPNHSPTGIRAMHGTQKATASCVRILCTTEKNNQVLVWQHGQIMRVNFNSLLGTWSIDQKELHMTNKITSDIPLAADVIARGGHALNPRGEFYTRDTIQERLTMRIHG
jgi:hypothetical protein